jgi:hypothetical protein
MMDSSNTEKFKNPTECWSYHVEDSTASDGKTRCLLMCDAPEVQQRALHAVPVWTCRCCGAGAGAKVVGF